MIRPAAGAAGHGEERESGAVPAPGLVNIANELTLLRFVLVPVFVVFLLTGGPGWRIAAFAAFAVASITDLLDGELARRRGLITDFGKIADPIADKALTGSAVVTLSLLGELSWWVTCIILVRELAVTGLRFWVIRRGVIAASRGGKVKTLLQVVAISLYVLPGPPAALREAVMAAAVAVTIVTGVDYGLRALRLHRAVPRRVLVSGAGGAGPAAAAPAAEGAVREEADRPPAAAPAGGVPAPDGTAPAPPAGPAAGRFANAGAGGSGEAGAGQAAAGQAEAGQAGASQTGAGEAP